MSLSGSTCTAQAEAATRGSSAMGEMTAGAPETGAAPILPLLRTHAAGQGKPPAVTRSGASTACSTRKLLARETRTGVVSPADAAACSEAPARPQSSDQVSKSFDDIVDHCCLEHAHPAAVENQVNRPQRLGNRRSFIVRIGINAYTT